MMQSEIESILASKTSLSIHLISGETYIGFFDFNLETKYLNVIGMNITFPVWAIKRIKNTPLTK
ncbi:hypothetical protein H1230_20620 [Paenibacillus sp. 19GGS1-52]|uniref:hypothetical protein n=1 Tax=Paenibacillus sp. 19GGS1-52 TaxID=2758563 RepID=UPI001EFB555C|nr:hypothetical protein [Paenibacillus sp. 19GGS1-52]ULO05474.1 hypothetical protein H1230_20620 [Paenibacillus sp. 19GGS1-52]